MRYIRECPQGHWAETRNPTEPSVIRFCPKDGKVMKLTQIDEITEFHPNGERVHISDCKVS